MNDKVTLYKVVAIVLNWNSAIDTVECVSAILRSKYSRIDVIVVDNDSTDDSVEILNSSLGQVCTILHNSENLGYAAGNRKGVEHAIRDGADYIWIVNPDCLVDGDALLELVKASQRWNFPTILSPLILQQDNPDLVYYGGTRRVPGMPMQIMVKNVSISKRPDLLVEKECSHIQGSNVLIPVPVIIKHGFMTDRFFMFGEETDYSLRLSANAVKSVYVPSSRAYHRGSGASFQFNELEDVLTYYRLRNQILLWYKYLPASDFRRMMIKWIFREIKDIIKRFRMVKAPNKWHMIAYWHALIGRSGRTFNPNDYVVQEPKLDSKTAHHSRQ